MTTDWDPWSYRDKSGMRGQGSVNLVGYAVEAADGGIGKVDEAGTTSSPRPPASPPALGMPAPPLTSVMS